MSRFRSLLILFSIFSICFYSKAQQATISGRVTSQNNVPVENIAVVLEGTQYGAQSDKDGKYRFVAPIGEYHITTSSIDYKPYKSQVKLVSGTNTININITRKDNELSEIVVLGGSQKFTNKESDYIARLPIKNLENPQAYSVIGKELMKEQMVVNFDDALKNTSGLDKLWSSTGRGGDGAAYFSLRGFATQPNMVNGIGSQTNGGLDPANIERIEVLKGPSGTLFGSSLVSFGGLINIVTKKPQNLFFGDLSYTMGSYGLNRIQADVNTPLTSDKKLLLRTNAAFQYQGSFQDAGFKRTFFFAPSVLYHIDDKTTLSLDAEFFTSEGTNPLMVFLKRGHALEYNTPKELDMDYKKSFTSNDITIKTPTVKLLATLDHKLSSEWTSQTIVSQSNRQSKGIYSYVMFMKPLPLRDDSLTRSVGALDATTTTVDIQQNFIGDFRIGNLRNRLVAGIDYFYSKDNSSSNYIQYDIISRAGTEPDYSNLSEASALQALAAKGSPYKSITKNNTYSVYFSDVLNVTDQLLVMASLRLDYFDNRGTSEVSTGDKTGKFHQTAWSPKFGAVYQLIPEKLSVFGNYMNGFKNLEPAKQPNQTVRTFKPQQANQFEAGFKVALFDDKLMGTISYYDIYVTDVVRPDPAEYGYTIQDGDIYSRGFEIDVTANPLPGLTIIGGYSHNSSENKKTDSSIDGRRPVEAGPKNLVNAWVSYTIQSGAAKGLGFGFGGNYASDNVVTNTKDTGKFTVPAYTILNATAFYTTGSVRFGLKVDNLTDKKYWKGWSTIEPQMLRQVIGNVSIKF